MVVIVGCSCGGVRGNHRGLFGRGAPRSVEVCGGGGGMAGGVELS